MVQNCNKRRRKSEEDATRGQPEASVNTKRLFFLDVGRGLWPPEISIQLLYFPTTSGDTMVTNI